MGNKASVLALALLCGLLVVGSSGFTAATVARPVGLDVVDDDRAFLSYDTDCDGATFVATLTNRFEATELRVTVAVNRTTRTVTLDPMADVTFRFDDAAEGDSVAVRGTNVRGGIAMQYTRAVPASCRAGGGR